MEIFNWHMRCWLQCASNVQDKEHPSSYLYIAWCWYKRDNTFVKDNTAVIKWKIILCLNISVGLSVLLGDIICAVFILRSNVIKRLITSLRTRVCLCSRVAGCGNSQRIVVCSSSQYRSHFRFTPSNSAVTTSVATVEDLQNTFQLFLLVFRIVTTSVV